MRNPLHGASQACESCPHCFQNLPAVGVPVLAVDEDSAGCNCMPLEALQQRRGEQRMRSSIAFQVTLCVFACIAGCSSGCSIRAEHDKFVDCWGREKFFHGVNVVYKGYPWYPETEHFEP